MIPKIIHYCWFGGKELPSDVKTYIQTWKKTMPEYELMQWNETNFDVNSYIWTKQAYEVKKYAFVADFVRVHSLFNYGGIYLDTDVENLKSFSPLLSLPYFIGKENTPSGIESATIGFEKGHYLLKLMYNYYKNRRFIKSDGSYDEYPIPFIIRNCIDTQFWYNPIDIIDEFINDEKVINVFPVDWFSPKTWDTKELNVTDKTYSIHHFAGSWLDKKQDDKEDLLQKNNIEKIIEENHFSMKGPFISFIKKMLYNKNVLFLSKTNFIESFCGFYEINDSNPLSNVVVPEKIERLIDYLVSRKRIEYDFVRIDQSENPQPLVHFYPIIKVKDIDIEIHLTNFYSKEEAIKFINEFNILLRIRQIIPYHKEPAHWNMLDIVKLCWKLNITKQCLFR